MCFLLAGVVEFGKAAAVDVVPTDTRPATPEGAAAAEKAPELTLPIIVQLNRL